MSKKDEFDLEFDFEKEYGFDPKEILDPETEPDVGAFDITTKAAPAEENSVYQPIGDDEELDFLSDDFLASLGIDIHATEDAEAPNGTVTPTAEALTEEASVPEDDELVSMFQDENLDENPALDFGDVLDETTEEVPVDFVEPAFDVDSTPDLGEDFAATYDEVAKENEAVDTPAQQDEEPAVRTELSDIPKRRRKMSKERILKEVYLPPIIAGLALVLIIWFIGGAIGRGVKNNKEKEDALAASNQASQSALQQEAEQLLKDAEALASGYDYDAALKKLDSFSGTMTDYKAMVDAYSAYTQARNNLTPMDDPASIPNLSFHGLIVDPARAFANEAFGISFKNNYVTVDEFSKILQQLYDKNYVLVDFDSFIVETTTEDGKTTYATQPIYLPADKKPLMLTQTLVNYETFSIDSNGDGEADAGGAGFASKLIIGTNGNITCEYVDAQGNTLTGNYDLVPILNSFLEDHPDFSYRGAKAILAVSGEDGVFGYRTMDSAKADKGEDYYNLQIDGAKKIAQALRNDGYTIACYTYGNVNYSELSATAITADLDAWKREVVPVLGKIDMIVYAKGCDISYTGNRYNVLKDAGFRYFIGAAGVPYSEINSDYVRQSRIMVTGSTMTKSPTTFANYFDAASVLNPIREGN